MFEVANFEDDVEGAPEVGDLVFEKAAGEGEDTMERLGDLEEWMVVY